MKKIPFYKLAKNLLAIGFISSSLQVFSAPTEIPHLEKRGAATQLIVNERPFLVLAGELHNSTSSSREYLQPFWPKLVAANLNTVLAAVSWDLIEPEESNFDFSMVDYLLEDARANDLKLVLLWFGSWKNGFSHYVPDWVKKDRERFPYALTRHGSPEVLSVFCESNWNADARAYAAFMKHLHEIDVNEQTVVMVQVENEVGLHADARDRSRLAELTFAGKVPEKLLKYLRDEGENLGSSIHELWRVNGYRTEGSWSEVFGETERAEEAFMAWHYASYVGKVAAAGKSEYAIPTFVNAWIVQPEDEHPGDYPTGGPQAHSLDLWKAATANIDLFCPDIYISHFQEVCEQYTSVVQNPLFVPESRAGIQGMAQAFLAIGRYDAIGYSPFGIEENTEGFEAYETLKELSPILLNLQGTDRLFAVSLAGDNASETFSMGGYRLKATIASREVSDRGYAIVVFLGDDEFIVAGGNIQIAFASESWNETVGIATVEEGRFEGDQWIRGRTLNGDEIMTAYAFDTLIPQHQTGTGVKILSSTPQIQKANLYRYEDSE